jgi:UDP-N-acetylglucosamine--N-acetylmuramyl-(pentapeptide) pyrophosphoryl-undecaprenol N-acetylglucosamine transferase
VTVGAAADGAIPIVVTGGGTGGHLYPGLAIARALVRADPRVRPFFVGAQRGIEREVLPTTEFPHLLLDLHPVYRQRPWENWRTLAGGVRAWRALGALFAAERPRAVVGTGGYAAGAALGYALARGVPAMLQEADSFPGLTTRLFARRAAHVFVGFPEAAARLSPGPGTRVHAFGNPIEPPPGGAPGAGRGARPLGLRRRRAGRAARLRREPGRARDQRGARRVGGRGDPDGLGLIWATGRGQHAPVRRARRRRRRARARGARTSRPIADAYAAADVALTRAGAMSIAELCAWGLPGDPRPAAHGGGRPPDAQRAHARRGGRGRAPAAARAHRRDRSPPRSARSPATRRASRRSPRPRPRAGAPTPHAARIARQTRGERGGRAGVRRAAPTPVAGCLRARAAAAQRRVRG